MRILYVINGFDPGGAEHGLLTLLDKGFFDGHDVAVLGLIRGRGDLVERIREAVGPGSFRIAVDVEQLSVRTMLVGARVLADELSHRRPDLVVLSLKQTNIVGRLVLSAFPSARCVAFEHIMRYRSRRFQWSYKYILWLLSYRVSEVWGDCQDTIDATAHYFMPVRRRVTNVVPLFCVPSDVVLKTGYAIDGAVRIAAAGRLSPVKNLDKLIMAIDQLRRRGTDVVLDIFGSGPEKAALRQLAAGLGLEEHVRLLGHRDAWFKEAMDCDVLVNASDTEGFCIVVGEAMSVGMPIVSTNVGGIREYGADGVNMVKLASPEPSEIASRIAELAGDEALRRRLGVQAAADMARDYSIDALKAAGKRILAQPRGSEA